MNLFIPLDRVTADALLKLADREVRTPKQQAVILIRDGLAKAGTLADERRAKARRKVGES